MDKLRYGITGNTHFGEWMIETYLHTNSNLISKGFFSSSTKITRENYFLLANRVFFYSCILATTISFEEIDREIFKWCFVGEGDDPDEYIKEMENWPSVRKIEAAISLPKDNDPLSLKISFLSMDRESRFRGSHSKFFQWIARLRILYYTGGDFDLNEKQKNSKIIFDDKSWALLANESNIGFYIGLKYTSFILEGLGYAGLPGEHESRNDRDRDWKERKFVILDFLDWSQTSCPIISSNYKELYEILLKELR